MEAVEFAGHQQLDNLILIYDSNAVTLDAMAKETQSEDTAKRFEAIGFDVETIDGHEMEAFAAAFERAKHAGSGKPQLIIAKTLIGKGVPEVEGTQKAHGEGGAKFSRRGAQGPGPAAGAVLRLGRRSGPSSPSAPRSSAPTYADVDQDVRRLDGQEPGARRAARGLARLRVHAARRTRAKRTPDTAALFAAVPEFPADTQDRDAQGGQDVLQPLAAKVPLLVGGSADLYGSTLNYIGDLKAGNDDFKPGHRTGQQHPLRHSRARHVLHPQRHRRARHLPPERRDVPRLRRLLPSARIRLAALSHLPVIYVFTHDSVGVGEDGPTHEPVETIPGLRVIPNLDVIRPADPEETAGAFVAALERTDGPTLLALTRQAVPLLKDIPVKARREGVMKGGYVARKETAPLNLILMSAGSELQHALKAAETLGPGTRVVSIPCFARFDRQPAGVPERGPAAVVPASNRHRGHGLVDVGAVRRPRRRHHRNRSLRPLGAGSGGHEGARDDGRARHRGRKAIALKSAAVVESALFS